MWYEAILHLRKESSLMCEEKGDNYYTMHLLSSSILQAYKNQYSGDRHSVRYSSASARTPHLSAAMRVIKIPIPTISHNKP